MMDRYVAAKATYLGTTRGEWSKDIIVIRANVVRTRPIRDVTTAHTRRCASIGEATRYLRRCKRSRHGAHRLGPFGSRA